MTRAELEALPEYSCTMPTGVTPGKRWRRNNNAYVLEDRSRRRWVRDMYRTGVIYLDLRAGEKSVLVIPEDWWLGEYREHPNPAFRETHVQTCWTRIVLTD